MYAIKLIQDSIANYDMWFDEEADGWTSNAKNRTTFANTDEANDFGELKIDGSHIWTIVRVL